MSEENNEITEGHSDYKPADSHNESIKHQLTGMYQNWFLLHTLSSSEPCPTSMTD